MEHWKQPDKGRHQQQPQQQQQQVQQAQNQNHNKNSQKGKPKVATSEHSAIIQQTNPIQSIANVLNHHHSKVIQHQKKSQQLEEQQQQATVTAVAKNKQEQQQQQQPTPRSSTNAAANGSNSNSDTPQESNLSSAFSHSSNQIDQGNSYLYAYNDFVTSTSTSRALSSNDAKLACHHRGLNNNNNNNSSTQEKELVVVEENGVGVGGIENLNGKLCEHIPVSLHNKSNLNFEANNQESLIDSEEDDALSYILHQHRAQRDARHFALQGDHINQNQNFHINNSNRPPNSNLAYNLQYEEQEEGNSSNFEAQRIDHHLSCSRSSHPRHICGIGGSHNDNLNNIAARLREESQRAFALNQRSRQVYPDSSPYQPHHYHHHHHHQLTTNDIATIQSHQFTHDLTIIQDQLANASTGAVGVHNHGYISTDHDHQDNKLSPHTSAGSNYLNNLNSELHFVPADRKSLLLDRGALDTTGRIINDSSNTSLNDHSQSTSLTQRTLNHHTRHQPRNSSRSSSSSSFLSWLFCCFCNLLSPSSSSSSSTTPTIQHHQHHSQANLVESTTNVTKTKRRSHKQPTTLALAAATNESTGAVGMYSTTSQQMGGVGQLGGQAGAYYTTQTPQTDTLHQTYTHPHHHHHYPLSSDSSMGSSVFATSALRMNAFFRSCCSKKCLFVSCLMLILLIFIFVIGLSAYLNFLINSNKTNLTPLSGRLKVESQGDSFIEQLSNRTSKEFLAKQQQYETILRGAFDRTQNLLKSYPNHLVKCEVYSFKQGSLWVYFRLFINKRTLMQDTQLMKRKSPDEHLDKQFLPRITQQTLHSGFEQLMVNFNGGRDNSNGVERRSRSSQFNHQPQAAELRQSRTLASSDSLKPSSQRDHVKSFDDQISRLMPIIESIDLQSIVVTPEFDMLQTSGAGSTSQQQSMSDNLRASQFLTTSASGVMIASGPNNNKNAGDTDTTGPSSTTTENSSSQSGSSSITPAPARPTTLQPSIETDITHTGSSDEVNVSTKKFFLFGYKENSTRPTTSSKPNVLQQQNRASNGEQQQESIFLVNHQQRKPTTTTSSPSTRANGLNIIPSPGHTTSDSDSTSATRQSNTLKEIISTRPSETVDSSSSKDNIVKLISGQPVLNRNNNSNENNNSRLSTNSRNRIHSEYKLDQQISGSKNNNGNISSSEFTILDSAKSQTTSRKQDKGVNETVLTQMVAPYQKIEFSLQPQQDLVVNSTLPQLAKQLDFSPQELWNNAVGNNKNKSATSKNERQQQQHDTSEQSSTSQPKRLITVTTIGGDNLGLTNNTGLDWHKISILSSEISNTIRANMNPTPMQTTTFPTSSITSPLPQSSTTQKPKVSPHLKQGGSLISPIRQGTAQETHSAVVLNRDFATAVGNNNNNNNQEAGQTVGAAGNNSTSQQVSAIRPTSQNRSDKRKSNGQRNVTLSDNGNNNNNNNADSNSRQRASKPTIKPHKLKKVSGEPSQFIASKNDSPQPVTTASSSSSTTTTSTTTASANTPSVTTTSNGTLVNSKGIRIVDQFLASINSGRAAELLLGNQNVNNSTNNLRHNQNHNNKNRTLEAFNYNADLIMPTLPATIELTRSTTSLPPARTTSFHPLSDGGGWSVGYKTTPGSADHYTTTSSSQTNQRYSTSPGTVTNHESLIQKTDGAKPKNVYMAPNAVHLSNSGNQNQHPKQQSSTPTSSFSSQWKPITLGTGNATALSVDESWIKNRTSAAAAAATRRPNIALIVNNERLTPLVNVPTNQGSQSPFAMSTSILEGQLKPNNNNNNLPFSQLIARRPNNRIPGNFHIGPGNEFESHRMSRMRLGDTTPSHELFNQVQAQSASTPTTAGPNIAESNTRIVDDFMITTDGADTRSSTQPPHNSLLNSNEQLSTRLRSVSPLDLQPKRTRGPFAFETLKSVSSPMPSSQLGAADHLDGQSQHLSELNLQQQQRSERSPLKLQNGISGAASEQKLLVRKNLFLGNGDEDEFKSQTFSSTTGNPNSLLDNAADVDKVSTIAPAAAAAATESEQVSSSNSPDSIRGGQYSELDQFGDRNRRPINSTSFRRQQSGATGVSTNHNQVVSASHSSNYNTFKCQYYGCNAKGSKKFVCLNYTQICDDFIDCQDESDELDCVSLLKHDSKSNRLSFSNGGGIIYLNRKGSLAPMCIDYFVESDNRLSGNNGGIITTNAAHLDSDLANYQLDRIKKQQELIKQINTIGQYACSLQSFSRLVSVKINHHDLVDSSNLIKTSKLYHRLSIVGSSDRQIGSDAQFGSYKSATSEHEVEVSTSTSCPSQRTVFVKCGSFECGQDSFSVIDRSNSTNRKDGVIINDFPWLVKLYWWGSLACHGYLIDELWLISSSECFVNKSQTANTDDGNGWTAEISYEHYGNDDYQTIESNRRIIKDIIIQPSDTIGAQNTKQNLGPSIVLAKFEKPIRFRPICLPLAAMNKTTFESDRMYKDCITATLPLPGSTGSSPTQDLLLNRVKVHKSADCLPSSEQQQQQQLGDDLICVAEMGAKNDGSISSSQDDKEDQATRVLICSSSQANRSRSKWTVVGVENKAQGLHLNANKRLFTTVSSQIDWIVDTMNPKSYPNNLGLDLGNNNSSGNELNPLSTSGVSQNQTCNRFKCSSGECLSWSRICDGLYDCSSHEDEKDCHR